MKENERKKWLDGKIKKEEGKGIKNEGIIKEEGRGKKEEWRKNKEEGIRKKIWRTKSEEGKRKINYGYFRDQQVKIYKNPCFVFDFTTLEFLTFFSTAIWTGSWWRRLLKWNRKPSFNSIYSNFQFQENRIKTVAVTVPSWLMEHMTVVTSSNMLMR